MIKDSGDRRQFPSGGVRDMAEGKGRCDLMPLDIVAGILEGVNSDRDAIVMNIGYFQESGDYKYLIDALVMFCHDQYCGDVYSMLLEVAKHFEEGAKKYAENNWRLGLNAKCYIDSGVRHYLKHLRGDTDEPHDRAFVWNMMCCCWTVKHIPELNDYAQKNERVGKAND